MTSDEVDNLMVRDLIWAFIRNEGTNEKTRKHE